MCRNQIGDAGATELAKNKTITTLHLGVNKIGDVGAEKLAQNKTLITLRLYGNQISDAGAIALARNTTLKTLHLGANPISDAGARDFIQNQTLIKLKLNENAFILSTSKTTIAKHIQSNKIRFERNWTIVTTFFLLRQGSRQGVIPYEIWQLITQFFNFPSLEKPKRSSVAMVNFVSRHLDEFNTRLTGKKRAALVEIIKPTSEQLRFAFFAPPYTPPAKNNAPSLLRNNVLQP